MGACACKNLELKDDAVIEQGEKNLIITIDETQLKEERAKAVKAFRTELGNKLKSTLRNFGEIVTEEEFNEKIPQHISEYSESYPFTEKYEDDMNNLLLFFDLLSRMVSYILINVYLLPNDNIFYNAFIAFVFYILIIRNNYIIKYEFLFIKPY